MKKLLGDDRVTTHRFAYRGRTLDNVIAEIPGEESGGIVLVGAHLDSMISFVPTYNPRVDPAPGADDDASGVAALLILAQTFKKLIESVDRPKKTIRFGFFNAEEVGLVGSAAYARDQAAHTVPIIAMFELDMIGYNKKSPKSCELHAGIRPFPDVEARSIVLADELKQVMASVSPDLAPQVYSTKTEPEGDPGDGRSDHGSFQERGYTACLAIEDLFPGPGGAELEGNPDYHRPTDYRPRGCHPSDCR
jgi:Zn-dependent M28 family amino/carboxypeptidase